MRQLSGRLTYANVIATLALFLALGGGAYAATRLPRDSVGARQLKNGSITPAKLSASAKRALKGEAGAQGLQGAKGDAGVPATNLWAVLDGEGKLARGSGVLFSGHPGPGRQTVLFNQDVSGCMFIATPGALDSGGNGSTNYAFAGQTGVELLEGGHGLVVTRANSAGELANTPVFVAVIC